MIGPGSRMNGNKLSIAHLLASNFFGGPEKQLVEHATCLDPSRFELHIVSFLEGNDKNQLLERGGERGIPTVGLESRNPFDPTLITRMCKTIRERGVDLLCVHGYKANVVGRIAAWLTGIPVIAISRGWTGESSKIRLYESLDRLFLRLADHVVAVSDGQRKKIVSHGGNPEKISVIRNAINLNDPAATEGAAIRNELKIPSDAIFVVSAGRLSPEKNYAGMIEVARQVAARRSDVYFAVFGEGTLRVDLEERVRAAGLDGRFLLPGFRNDLQAILAEIDIFMLPSFTEGLPNVVLESFAARKPVVATAVGGTPEVVQDGVSGFLSAPSEVEAMANHVVTLASDSVMRAAMGKAGYSHISKRFSFTQQTKSYERLYETIHNRRNARP